MIKELHQKLINREISAVTLAENYFQAIAEKNENIRAFLTLTKEEALRQAAQIDDKIRQGKEIGTLEGIPYAVKDNILVHGISATAGSKILETYTAAFDATVIKKLKEEGAVVLGKTNMDEFAMGSSTENSAFAPTKNPRDLTRVPGGSSGGSAASVAGQMSVFALGSDTGGSIRQPACFCGIVGLKPSYGSVSRFGLMAMASSLDVIGPLAQTVEDAEIVFRAICGKDKYDSTSQDLPADSQSAVAQKEIKNTVFGLPREYFQEGLNEEIKKSIMSAVEKIKDGGAKIKEVSLPLTPYALPCYYIIMPAEVSSNLARFDCIRYAPMEDLHSEIADLNDVYFKTRGRKFGAEVRRRIVLGTYVLSSGYYDAYYKKAQQVRKLIAQEFQKVFAEVDFLITPTAPTLPFRIGEKIDDPLAMYLSDIFTVSANIVGAPAINLPCGQMGDLSTSMQIIGPSLSDFALLNTARQIETIIA